MILSQRLCAVASMVTRGLVLADIGTDHAYIPVELVRSGKIPSAIAMDVNEGPLARARANIRASGLEDRIPVRLSDGMKGLASGEAQCAVIAGMGGGLVMKILRESPDTARELSELVLQPQSEVREVRRYLYENGFAIRKEDMVLEDGKYYPIMKACPVRAGERTTENSSSTGAGEEELFLMYGPCLLEKRHPVLKEYLLREEKICLEILENLCRASGERAQKRRREVMENLRLAQTALKTFYT